MGVNTPSSELVASGEPIEECGRVRMSPSVHPAQGSSHYPEIGDALRYVARQPILDLRGQVHGYELLFRGQVRRQSFAATGTWRPGPCWTTQ